MKILKSKWLWIAVGTGVAIYLINEHQKKQALADAATRKTNAMDGAAGGTPIMSTAPGA